MPIDDQMRILFQPIESIIDIISCAAERVLCDAVEGLVDEASKFFGNIRVSPGVPEVSFLKLIFNRGVDGKLNHFDQPHVAPAQTFLPA